MIRGGPRFRVAPLVLGLVSLELAAGLALLVLAGLDLLPPRRASLTPEDREELSRHLADGAPYVTPSPELGWTIRPDGERDRYRANAQGLRSDRTYAAAVPAGGLRIGAFGDSFTHGDEVELAESWPRQLEQRVGGLEVLNFGVPAYGPDQAYLRYEEAAERFELPIVLFGVMTADLLRTVNVFRPFLRPGGMPFAKPRYLWREEALELLPNPLPADADYRRLLADEQRMLARLGENDYFYGRTIAAGAPPFPFSLRLLWTAVHEAWGRADPWRPFAGGVYNVRSPAYRITRALCGRLAEVAGARGSRVVILLFPSKRDIRQAAGGGVPRYEPLLRDLSAAGLPVLDLAAALAAPNAPPPDALFATGHYNAAGNAIVAQRVLDYLLDRGLLPRSRIDAGRARS